MNPSRFEQRAYSIAALRRMARRRLPRVVFDFIDGGAEDELTRQANETDFAAWYFLPTPLQGAAERDLSVELFGRRLALPVIIGPTGLAGMTWPRGERAAADAAAAAGTVYCMSHGSTVSIEDLARVARGLLWFQVFMYRDRGLTRTMTERARDAGYEALVLTVDNQVLGQRERDLRNGFTIPPRLTLRSGLDLLRCLPWLRQMANARDVRFANYGNGDGSDILSLGGRMAELLDPGASWRDVEWLRGLWPRRLVLKGILHPDEARQALAAGVDAVIVSNHGGRQLDGAVSSVRALPEVAGAVGGRMPVLVDGGIRRGAHIAKALALGASACLIGRPHLFGLAVAGEAGVRRVLEIYRSELDRVMALGGWTEIGRLDRRVLVPAAGIPAAPGGAAAELAASHAEAAE
jgi:isopentenyl diphosphate isomerase/L-lactate dehydrogenase-like FMN-dependent dehydrogenase